MVNERRTNKKHLKKRCFILITKIIITIIIILILITESIVEVINCICNLLFSKTPSAILHMFYISYCLLHKLFAYHENCCLLDMPQNPRLPKATSLVS